MPVFIEEPFYYSNKKKKTNIKSLVDFEKQFMQPPAFRSPTSQLTLSW